MDEQILKLAEQLLITLETNGGSIVQQYSKMMITNAITYLTICSAIVFAISKTTVYKGRDKDYEVFSYILRVFVIIISVLIMGDCIVDLFNPEASGIQQMIKDLRG